MQLGMETLKGWKKYDLFCYIIETQMINIAQ